MSVDVVVVVAVPLTSDLSLDDFWQAVTPTKQTVANVAANKMCLRIAIFPLKNS
jgi:hypothetical protein